ncbi:polysaccharide biosynthesis/export family protein [Roseateles toxinivorans]|uniref:Protein involved in polysaccharide export with SLBB domain n=1 Tax=Roseateles toxinivorans TaxID=270368 RepID=A0A4R6QPG0_9BURK|nr:polysaccharide biosynthesis/export family protein [Roseateles toxinivorans]TDP71518.1 protein involved in polysaccharide export with SLBB domain [Roseateles toxinivorans]
MTQHPSSIIAALLLSAASLLAGCVTTAQNVGQRAIPAATYMAQDSDGKKIEGGSLSYQLQPGDQIDIKFYYNPELNEQALVGPDGRIALQLIGELNVSGLSTQALSDELTKRYGKTLRQPQATVILRKYALARVFVSGEVNAPSAHALDAGPITALQAIVQSGGFRKGAERSNVVVLRNSASGQPVFIKLDMQGHLEQAVQADILLRPYDIVFVPQKRIAEVAEFFEEYINKIVPLYRNMGFYFNYDLRDKVEVRTSP